MDLDSGSEVLIIGGGVIGLSIARELHKRGVRDIAIIERGEVGHEASWAAAGMLSPNVETEIGAPFHNLCRRSLDMYPQFAAGLFEFTGIDIELDQSGTLFVSMDDESGSDLMSEYRKLRDGGVEVDSLSKEEILRAEPLLSSLVQIGISFPDDCQVENRKLIAALRKFARDNAIQTFEQTEVSELIVVNGSVRGARTNGGEFHAERTILAAGAWTSLIEFGSEIAPFRIKPIRGQMISFDCGDRLLEKVVYGPGCYLVPRKDGRILVGSTTEDVGFENSVSFDAVGRLKSAAFKLLPKLRTSKFGGAWAGLRPRSDDELPVIGEVDSLSDLTIATGHYRNGILLAPITAKIVADNLIDGTDFPAEFTPGRSMRNSHIATV